MSHATKKRSQRALGAAAAAMILGYATLAVYALHASMPFNLVRLPLENKDTIRLFFPESWKFFTRNPQEEQASAFLHTEDGWRPASAGPNSAAANRFGLDRRGRAEGVELGLVAGELKESMWIVCNGAPSACLDSAPVAARVKNPTPSPKLCGEVGVVLQKPVPWAWARSKNPVTMPARVVKIEVQCSRV